MFFSYSFFFFSLLGRRFYFDCILPFGRMRFGRGTQTFSARMEVQWGWWRGGAMKKFCLGMNKNGTLDWELHPRIICWAIVLRFFRRVSKAHFTQLKILNHSGFSSTRVLIIIYLYDVTRGRLRFIVVESGAYGRPRVLNFKYLAVTRFLPQRRFISNSVRVPRVVPD